MAVIVTKAKRYQSGGELNERSERDLDREPTKSDGLRAEPKFVTIDKNFKGAGGRLSYTKNLDKNSSIQAYVDAMAGKPAGQSAFISPQKVGVEYRRSFANGGMTASKRADGLAQRGKTRGKMV